MIKLPTLASLLLLGSAVHAADHGELLFSDDFERSESQEVKDEPGNGWGTNSRTRAKGNKQVDLRDGAMYIYIHKEANHAVSVTHPAEFTDGAVEMKFKLEGEKDNLGLDFADLQYKPVHAGHLFVARVNPKQVMIQDMKTGSMDLKIREARESKTLTEEQKKMLATKTATFPHKTKVGEWHDLLVEVKGDTVSVSIDGKEVGSFSSEGFAHPTKRLLRLSVPHNVAVDDVKIWKKA